MEIFINEVSLEGQYVTETEFTNAVRIFYTIFLNLNRKIKDNIFYKDSQLLFDYQAIKNSNFTVSINKIPDKSLKRAFTNIIFNKLDPKDWRKEQVHSANDNFDYITETIEKDVRNTSLAEVTERSLQNQENFFYLLVNFTSSSFNLCHPSIQDCCSIPIIKNNELIYLEGLDNESGLENWLKIRLNLYDESSQTPPMDEQTILSDGARFRKTTSFFQDRTIYQELATHRYWYVDNFHIGNSAHLEVFDKVGKHIGEADLEGNIDESKQDTKKRLNYNDTIHSLTNVTVRPSPAKMN